MSQKYSAILLCFCLIAPLTGTYLWLMHKKQTVRRQVKLELMQGKSKDELILFTLSKAQAANLDWHEDEEFSFEREMYDVVFKETQGDSIKLWCWPDHRESSINHDINLLLARRLGRNQKHQENQKRLAKFYQSLFVNTLSQHSFCMNAKWINHNTHYLAAMSMFAAQPPIPPPRNS